ncbi:hypothetical protein D7Z26_14850 [Cohnella endophytica]|uniref:Uncharacterized protein n=1 Tax=Cohnella endophytica TaxID=2419778 RepID=A0A494XQW2_9BACL|nr:hypothetical protein [Cohnella endophytica]RKP53017.1 hypothetical protein D7Z26_14850 [Cohnella endophytica]
MRSKIIYAIVFVLIAGSWAGNIAYYRDYRLPEGGFLNHRIETMYDPGVSFDLLYVANTDDKKKPVSVRTDELPSLRFYPAQVHSQLSHQTIYLLRGYFDVARMEERTSELAPIVLDSVYVSFSDGTESLQRVGNIVAYREARPIEGHTSPFSMSSVSSGSDHSGRASVRMTRPMTLTNISSSWLSELGDDFQYAWGADSETSGQMPTELKNKDALYLSYQFLIPHGSPRSLDVYNVLLRQDFVDSKGQKYANELFANYLPYPTEAEMRAYVREKRSEAK